MMHDFAAQQEQIQLLIDRVRDHTPRSGQSTFHDCNKLLKLAQQFNYSYGLAVAHAYLAQHARGVSDDDGYRFHVAQAMGAARERGYRDVLITCITLEGLRAADSCNESEAMSLFLDGVALATKLGDPRTQGILYYHIADLFYSLEASADAANFYTRALDTLDAPPCRDADLYRGMCLMNLARLSCLQGDADQAEHHLAQCPGGLRDGELLALLALEMQARIACLQGRAPDALRGVASLISALDASPESPLALRPLYLSLMELLLQLKHRAHADWCLGRIDALYAGAEDGLALRVRRLHVQYADTFGLASHGPLTAFHLAAQRGEQASRDSTANSFKSLITLFEAEKEQRRMLDERTHLLDASERDELTGIYNRRYYSKLISKLLLDDQVSSLGYVMVDVDFFKEYNDHYGHAAGDVALREVAQLLQSRLPPGAYAARYGGDEFSCLLVNRTGQDILDFAAAVQEGLRHKNLAHEKGGPTGRLTLSLGIYHTSQLQGCDEMGLIRQADKALYQAKQRGRNTHSYLCDGGNHHES